MFGIYEISFTRALARKKGTLFIDCSDVQMLAIAFQDKADSRDTGVSLLYVVVSF